MDNGNAKVDAREYAPKDKQPIIFKTFDSLQPGETMELVNDHDPSPLRHMFNLELPRTRP